MYTGYKNYNKNLSKETFQSTFRNHVVIFRKREMSNIFLNCANVSRIIICNMGKLLLSCYYRYIIWFINIFKFRLH